MYVPMSRNRRVVHAVYRYEWKNKMNSDSLFWKFQKKVRVGRKVEVVIVLKNITWYERVFYILYILVLSRNGQIKGSFIRDELKLTYIQILKNSKRTCH
jgi:hypothetical protein